MRVLLIFILPFFACFSNAQERKIGQFSLVDSSYHELPNGPSYVNGLNGLSSDVFFYGERTDNEIPTDIDYFVPICLTIGTDSLIKKIVISSNERHFSSRATQLIYDLPSKWNPALKMNGKTESSTICFTLKYRVYEELTVTVNVPPPPVTITTEPVMEDPETVIYDFPDIEASFPSGPNALLVFLKDNLVYPEEAKEKGEQGKVYVSFIVETDGRLTDLKIERGVSWSLDAEAKRLVRLMPNWNPGQMQGKAVRTRVRLPLAFTLNN